MVLAGLWTNAPRYSMTTVFSSVQSCVEAEAGAGTLWHPFQSLGIPTCFCLGGFMSLQWSPVPTFGSSPLTLVLAFILTTQSCYLWSTIWSYPWCQPAELCPLQWLQWKEHSCWRKPQEVSFSRTTVITYLNSFLCIFSKISRSLVYLYTFCGWG